MKTNLITREGFDKLKKELDFLWREERPEVTKKVTWAASLGDRSENADSTLRSIKIILYIPKHSCNNTYK